MPEIVGQTKESIENLDPNAHIHMPVMELPSFRLHYAIQKKINDNLLFVTGGGLGDYICSEPVFRYAFLTFRDCKISLLSKFPQLFKHLPFDHVFDENVCGNNFPFLDYFTFRAMPAHEGLQAEFMVHMWNHGVDYISMLMFKSQLPNKHKCIHLYPSDADNAKAEELIDPSRHILIHPGKTWVTRTYPKWWWDRVLNQLKIADLIPVIIGSDTTISDRATVDVDTTGCIDLRNKLSIMESVALCQRTRVILTNDSAPVHMAASGRAWIGFIATARHPDFVYHWRNNGEYAWRMKDFSKGGMWETYSLRPEETLKTINISVCEPDKVLEWIPEPEEFARWGIEKHQSWRD